MYTPCVYTGHMKHLDLSVVKNFPRIPEIKLVVEKNGEVEVFSSFKALISWIQEALSKEVEEGYGSTQKRCSTFGMDYDPEQWLYSMTNDDLDCFLWDCGWRLTKVAV